MRTFLIRGAMITFFAVTGLFGSAATVQFDGMSANVQTYSAEARMKADPLCTMKPEFPDYDGDRAFWVCKYR